MNKVINGKRYDTKTARLIGSAETDLPESHSSFWKEELYRTKSGNHFLYGKGGSTSHYATHEGGTTSAGEEIKAFSFGQAQRWGEIHMTPAEYRSFFSGASEEKIKISADLSPDAKIKLDLLKNRARKSNGDVIEYLLTLVE